MMPTRRRARRFVIPLLAALCVQGVDAIAQETESVQEMVGGAGFVIATPRGEFENYADPMPGLGLFLAGDLGQSGILGLRGDLSVVFRGSDTRRQPIPGTLTYAAADVTLQSLLASLTLGPQLALGIGPFRPFLDAGLGFSYFNTTESVSLVDYSDDEEEHTEGVSETVSSDYTFAWVWGGGLSIDISGSAALIVSAHYLNNGRVRYVTRDDMREALENRTRLVPTRSTANLLMLQVAFSYRGPID